MWVACHGDERVIDSVGFDYLASVGHVERTRDLSFLEQCTFFCLDRQITFWAPNCIRIVEYEIAKTTVETNCVRCPLFSLKLPESSITVFAESWLWRQSS